MANQRRPQLHFTPPQAWMNDPNGLVFHDGEYHLFYQYHPESLVWGPMHWGHAVSRDLLSWEHLPVALAPDELGTIFSGSAVWDGDNTSGLASGGGLVAVFSYNTQAQGLALSTDRGRTWAKYAGNPVIPSPNKDFRDPKVFWDVDHWTMVLAVGDHLEFYRSPNLREWALEGRFDAALDVGVWECPDLFPLPSPQGTRWVLVLSVGDKAINGGSGTLYWIGQWARGVFTPETGPLWLDGGTDNYAAVTWNNAPGGERLIMGWMNNWRYGRALPADTWRGSMTLPRVLTLSTDGMRLAQTPVAALEARRVTPQPLPVSPVPEVSDSVLTVAAHEPVTLAWYKGTGEELTLVWNPQQATLTLDRSRAGQSDFHPDWVTTMVATLAAPASVLGLRVLFDVESVEIFAEDGQTALTALLFPTPGAWTLSVTGAHRVGGTVWTLLS